MTIEFDKRYLLGMHHFNLQDYFEAHEIWEEVWNDCSSTDRRFFQSLIQAAVALHHANRGNRIGADRLFHSGRKYMQPYAPAHLGLNVQQFWDAVEKGILHLIPPRMSLDDIQTTNANPSDPRAELSPS